MISSNYYHKVSLMDEKTKEIYSRKFQFHMIELKKLENVKEKQKRRPLYRWAKLIAAQTWEELEQESKGNKYMERALEEMIKISQDEMERYLYLREEMAESDRVSQIQSAQRIGRNEGKKEGDILRLIMQIQKKIKKDKDVIQIADELEEAICRQMQKRLNQKIKQIINQGIYDNYYHISPLIFPPKSSIINTS